MTICDKDKLFLLNLARREILDLLGVEAPSTEGPDDSDCLQVRCGAFVSLYCGDQLRGCIGTFSEEDKLIDNVKRMARSAAASDPRFEAIRPDEMKELKIEISVLTPRRKVEHLEDIIPGKHGIYIQKGSHRGTLLPQVAERENWDAEQFLGYCSKYKAGLGWQGWKDAELSVYEAIVFCSLPDGIVKNP